MVIVSLNLFRRSRAELDAQRVHHYSTTNRTKTSQPGAPELSLYQGPETTLDICAEAPGAHCAGAGLEEDE